MKKLLLLVSFGVAIMSFTFPDGTQQIVNAFKRGDANEVASYFDNLIDLKLPEKDELKNVSKNQAGITLKEFFDQNRVTGFDVTSQRELSGTMYITGKLATSTKDYGVTVLMKARGDKIYIITVRIS
ncbi:MAG: DUF4783 domain-containing protein [Ilyomonas sp.]